MSEPICYKCKRSALDHSYIFDSDDIEPYLIQFCDGRIWNLKILKEEINVPTVFKN